MERELLTDQPLGQKLIKKGFWLYFFTYLTIPATYFIKVIISNSLSVADVGILYSIVSLIGLLNIYNDLWLTESLQYFLPRYWIKKQYNYAKTAIYLSFIIQIFTALLIVLLLRRGTPRLATHYFHSSEAAIILKYFCFYFLGINILQTLQSIFMAFQDTFSYQISDLIRNRAILGFTVFFFVTGTGNITNYSLNRVLWLIIGIIIAWYMFWKKYKKQVFQWKIVFDKPMIREYTKYALRCFLWLNVLTLFTQITQQIVIIMIGAEAAWYYTNFISLFLISNVILWPIMNLIFPLISELITKNDNQKLSTLFNIFYTYFTVLALSLAGIFLVIGPEIALIIYGKNFLFSWELLSRSSLFTVLVILFGFNYFVLAGMGKIKERVKILAIATIVNIISDIILIQYFNIYGALISLVISWIILFIFSYRLVTKIHKIHLDRKFICQNIIYIAWLSSIIYYIKDKIFIIDNSMRYTNLGYMIIIIIWFYLLFCLFNYKKLWSIKKEMTKIVLHK